MGYRIPEQYLQPATELLLDAVNSRITRLGALDITDAEVVDGQLHLVGTGPQTVAPAESK